jgi:hypothetical protein
MKTPTAYLLFVHCDPVNDSPYTRRHPVGICKNLPTVVKLLNDKFLYTDVNKDNVQSLDMKMRHQYAIAQYPWIDLSEQPETPKII